MDKYDYRIIDGNTELISPSGEKILITDKYSQNLFDDKLIALEKKFEKRQEQIIKEYFVNTN